MREFATLEGGTSLTQAEQRSERPFAESAWREAAQRAAKMAGAGL